MSSDSALAAYWEFFRSFNSRDPVAFSATLNYPHVRVSAHGTPAMVGSAAEHAAAASWERVLATGWDHSDGHEPELIHGSDDRAHIAGGWTRLDAAGGKVLVNRVTYIVTRAGPPAGWGIQSRFGIDGGNARDGGETSAHHGRAVALVEDYIDAYNDRDWARCAALMVTPHFKIDVGLVRQWTAREELLAAFRDGPWHFVTEVSARAVQAGESCVTVALDGLLDGGDRTLRGVFFVVDKGAAAGGWGIQARSIIET